MPIRPALLASLALLLAACNQGGDYPSLARRPAELIGTDGKPVASACAEAATAAGRPADGGIVTAGGTR